MLAWCFPDRATANTDAALKRLEAAADSAVVPPIWQLEVANALGKAMFAENWLRNALPTTRQYGSRN
jgi:hypothetical protein